VATRIEDSITRERPADDWTDFVHTGPGTLAGRYLRRFWQPVARSQDLPPGRAYPLRVMSEDLTLYRGEAGAPHLLAFRCAHRGTQLSTGWVEGDDLRCFYHGWKYGPTGQCLEQPAEPAPFCERIAIRAYPTEEYLGLIFAYLGEGAPPPLPRYPELEADGLQIVETYSWPCNFFNTLDNDPIHGAFVHRKPGLPRGVFYYPRVSARETDWGMEERRVWADGEYRISQKGMPNVHYNMRNPNGDPESGWLEDISWMVPMDDDRFVKFAVLLAHLSGEAAARYLERRTERFAKMTVPAEGLAEEILAGRREIEEVNQLRAWQGAWTQVTNVQDYVTQVGQGRIADHSIEHLGQTDVTVILFRNLWQRELRALAEGRPLKEWQRTADVAASCSEHASNSEDHLPVAGAAVV
jgi:5,5'-dehydrodivanillate O-demethylase